MIDITALDNTIPKIDLISYDQVFDILHEKFQLTHDELRYYIKKSLENFKEINVKNVMEGFVTADHFVVNDSSFSLIPYASDLPFNGMYENPPDGFFFPEVCFYDLQCVLIFVPCQHVRFVYQKDLTSKRNWNDHKNDSRSLVSEMLLKANEYGILRFYNKSYDEFTIHANKFQLWSSTFDGESYVTNPDSFFLLNEILTIERVFFKRDRQSCLAELNLIDDGLPENVYKFNKK